MPREKPKMPYVYGELEGLGRRDHPQQEEDERVAGGAKQKIKEIGGKTKFLPIATIHEHSYIHGPSIRV